MNQCILLPPSQNDCPYPRIFFGPKMIVRLRAQLEIEAQSQIFSHQSVYIKEYFDSAISGTFWSSCVFYLKSHTYNNLVSLEVKKITKSSLTLRI